MYYDIIREDYPVCDSVFYVILKDKSLSRSVKDYAFWFVKRLNSKEMFEVAEWCDENIKDDYLIGKTASGFKEEHDAMAFRLRWI